MGFDARKAVAALDWSFRPYLDVAGTVPEPTDDELKAMNAKLRKAMLAVGGESFDPSDRAALIKAFSSLTDEQLAEMDVQQLDAVSIVTKTSPTREDLEKLARTAPRVRRIFVEWLLTELNGGEQGN